MGRRSQSGGVRPKGDRIEFDLLVNGKRRKPTIDMAPTQANLKYARKRHAEIKRKIRDGSFVFSEEFPDYKLLEEVESRSDRPTFNTVADTYLRSIGDLEHATRVSYRKIVDNFWRAELGEQRIDDIRYSVLARILGEASLAQKTKNNRLAVLKSIFKLAKADRLIKDDPTELLQFRKVQKEPPDPYTVEEAEAVIAKMRSHYGEQDGNYCEWGFFTGTRPSEAIAIGWSSVDLRKGLARIDRARVMAHDKDRTKTFVWRDIELCQRALLSINSQRAITGLANERVFPYHDLQVQWRRWRTVHKLLGIRYREPYQMRHTSVTWNLMIGKNPLWVAEQHGHSVQVMLGTYAKWLKGSSEEDIQQIKRAMGYEVLQGMRRGNGTG